MSQVVTGLTNGCRIVNRYSYDEVGKNITAIRHNDFSYNLLYDSNGNNTEIDVGSNLLAAYSYDTYGNLTEIEYGNADCLDCLISEFNFRSQKWRVELWKSRYGINRGAEIGFYRRDEKIKLFKGFYACLKKEEGLMQMNFALYESDTNKKCNLLFERSTDDEGHWWLTGFLFDGWLSLAKGKPDNLVLDANITFYDSNMASLFDRNLGSRVKDGEFKTHRTNEKVNVVWASYDGVYCFYDAENQIIRKVNINNA